MKPFIFSAAAMMMLSLSAWPFRKRRAADEVVEAEPEDSDWEQEAPANWAIAINLALMGRFADALKRFQAMSVEDPENPALHYNIGLAHLEMGNSQEAIESFGRAVQLAPDHADSHANLAAALQAVGRLPEAYEEYSEAVRLRSDEPSYYYNWGTALMAEGDCQEALDKLGRAYNREPLDPQYSFNFALCLARSDREEDARRVLQDFSKSSRGRYPEREEWARQMMESRV